MPRSQLRNPTAVRKLQQHATCFFDGPNLQPQLYYIEVPNLEFQLLNIVLNLNTFQLIFHLIMSCHMIWENTGKRMKKNSGIFPTKNLGYILLSLFKVPSLIWFLVTRRSNERNVMYVCSSVRSKFGIGIGNQN